MINNEVHNTYIHNILFRTKQNPIKKRIVNNLCYNKFLIDLVLLFVVIFHFIKYSYRDNKFSNKFLNYFFELFQKRFLSKLNVNF